MKKSVKRLINAWMYLGLVLMAVLAGWAGDWTSYKLVFTLLIGAAAALSIALPVASYYRVTDKSGKQFIRVWISLAIILIAILAFWASDWKTDNLPIALALGIITFISIAIPVKKAAKLFELEKSKE